MERLTPELLVALSVAKLEAELSTGEYTADELTAAIELENAKDEPRKTAVEAMESRLLPAQAPAPAPAPAPEAGHRVAKGKAVTTKAGIKSEGDLITAAMLAGGEDALTHLIKKGYIA